MNPLILGILNEKSIHFIVDSRTMRSVINRDSILKGQLIEPFENMLTTVNGTELD